MRLIDKDLVLKTAKDKEWGLWCEIVNIKFAPEVNAIPVEWIKKWISERNDFPTMPYNQHILNMLEDWEAENAQNKENTSQTD